MSKDDISFEHHTVGTLVERERQRQSLAHSALARRMAWDPDEGTRTLRDLEHDDYLLPTDEELDDLAEGLGMELESLRRARWRTLKHIEQQEFEPSLDLHYSPRGRAQSQSIPHELESREEFIAYAQSVVSSSDSEMLSWAELKLSPLRKIRFEPDGTMCEMTLGPGGWRDVSEREE